MVLALPMPGGELAPRRLLNRIVGVEGEVVGSLGVAQDLQFGAPAFFGQDTR